LEAILHPPIRAWWMARVESARRTGTWLLLDIPLLYETGAERACDAVAVIACREETQRDRIVSRRGLSAEMARKIIASQTSLASKAARADYVIWNDAPEARLEEQAELFAGYLILWMNNLPR
jgi:dephospho-CoA kinase